MENGSLESNVTGIGGLKEVIMMITGIMSSQVKYESGTG